MKDALRVLWAEEGGQMLDQGKSMAERRKESSDTCFVGSKKTGQWGNSSRGWPQQEIVHNTGTELKCFIVKPHLPKVLLIKAY